MNSKRDKTPAPLMRPPDPAWVETRRELGQLLWALLLIDAIAIGLGALAARPMGAFAYKVGLGLAAFVTVCFLVLILGNLAVAAVFEWRRKRRRRQDW